MDAVIAVRDFSFRYEDSADWVLRDITLDVRAGEIMLVLGSSGCGKSSLALALNGVVPHLTGGKAEGAVTVCGTNVLESNPSVMARKVGFVFQDPEIQLFAMSVEDEIAMSLENLGMPRDEMRRRVDWALDTVGLRDLEERSPASLSGGQKQRVAIASVLAREPEVLIFDEPTGNLDPASSRAVLETIRSICNKGNHTVLLVEKDIGPVVDLVDRVVLIDEGRAIATGTPREVLRRLDLLERCGIKVPATVRVALFLEEHGVEFGMLPLSPRDLGAVLPRLGTPEPPAPSPAVEDEVIVAFHGVTHQFKNGYKGLDSVDLAVGRGDFVALLGMNGAGKSTMVLHIIGILRPTGGTVLIDGQQSANFTVAQMARKVGFIFQNPNHQIFNDTVFKEVSFGPRNLGWEEERVKHAVARILDLVGLEGMEERDPERLSIGQKQRVALASILVMDPDVLILDEPTTGQDESTLEMLMDITTRLNATGKTVIMITHDMELALKHANRVVLLDRGRIVWQGQTAEAFGDAGRLQASSLDLPEVLQITSLLSDTGVPWFVRSVEELMPFLVSKGVIGRVV
ncbi:MAG: energy-coupling factor transporter ATPase [bacterium]|nr:energy-coupling factor transporter ATPase [bacterium]